ncbi:MAG TPA: VWA domain-containing protein [Opitutaceae bacterium]|nr:VWA domain-containing protein [Opitutaceae bacterium]
MNWLVPAYFAAAGAVALPVALHLFRRRRRRPERFPSLRFVQATAGGDTRLRQVRRWLVLALRCAALILLAAAFAWPYRIGARAQTRRAVVVVADNAFSERARGQWEQIRHWALQQIGTLKPGDELGLMVTAPRPRWLAPLTADTAVPLQRLGQLEPGWSTAPVEPALRMAGELLSASSAPRRELIVLTDYQRAAWAGTDFSRPLPAKVRVAFSPPLSPPSRQAALSHPVLAANGTELDASVTASNFTSRQTRRLRVYAGNSPLPLHDQSVDLDPDARLRIRFTLPVSPREPAYFRFALDGDDLAADDAVYAVWQPGPDYSVVVDPPPAGDTADFVWTAMQSAADVAPPMHIARIAPGPWPIGAAAILRNDASFSGAMAGRLDQFLAAGGAALIFATSGPAQAAWMARQGIRLSPLPDRQEGWSVGRWDLDQPFAHALSRGSVGTLLGWNFSGGWALGAGEATPLAYWRPGSLAMGEVRIGRGRALICGFPPDRSAGDWPVTPSFLPFLREAAGYLLRSQRMADQTGTVGHQVSLPGPSGEWVGLAGPAQDSLPSHASGSAMPAAPGVYQYGAGPDRVWVAANLSPEGSDTRPWTAGQPWTALISPAPVHAAPPNFAALPRQQIPLWWWPVVAALLCLLGEMVLANRTAR